MKEFKYIYGPVLSWRLGRSLGIDLLSCKDKICNFNCAYCQIKETKFYTVERKIFAPTEKIIEEIKNIPAVPIDYITFSGRGEPTLAKNLGDAIKEIKKMRKEPIAVLTNSSLLPREDVREDLLGSDLVSCKIDAKDGKEFLLMNRPESGISFESVLSGIIKLRKRYKNKFAVQIMFTKENIKDAQKIAKLVKLIKPDEVEINTPMRLSSVKALSKSDIFKIRNYFKDFYVITVYDKKPKKSPPISRKGISARRGKESV